MCCTRILAASAILAMSIWTLPCLGETAWRGRPWHTNTNAPTWQALQAEYQPFEQLVEALIERADVVRAAVNTNYPRIELVQTWTVDAGVVTNAASTNTALIATGFPPAYGFDLNGTYEKVDDENYMRADGEYIFFYYFGWYIGYFDYYSETGPESDSWVDGYTLAPVTGSTALSTGPGGVLVDLVTTNVVTTNAFGPFRYSVEVDGTTYSGTGFPHLTYSAMEWIDQQIDALSAYYMPVVYETNSVPGGPSVWLWQREWDAHGEHSLIGNADVGRTETGEYVSGGITNAWEVSAYTRQPPVTSQWLMAEWAWGATNWVAVVSGGETNLVSQDGWIGGPLLTEMDLRLTNGASGPFIEAYSTSGAPISVSVELRGSTRRSHWWPTDLVTGAVEVVESGSHATNLWHQLSAGTSVVTGNGTSTGDHVIVSYKGPITLYGARPYRLYASDLDERAAVIDGLRYLYVDHDTREYAGYTYNAWTNVHETSYSATNTVVADTNNLYHPAWSPVTDFSKNSSLKHWLYHPPRTWGRLERNSVPFYEETFPYRLQGYSNSVIADAYAVAGQLSYTFTFATNTLQGTNMPAGFTINTSLELQWPGPWFGTYENWDGHPDLSLNQPPPWIPRVSGYGYPVWSTNLVTAYSYIRPHLRWQAVSEPHTVLAGVHTYTSGIIGYTNLNASVWNNMPYLDSSWQPSYWYETLTMTNEPSRTWGGEVGVSGYGHWWQAYDEGFGGRLLKFPGFIDWGTTNGFRYRKE